MTHNFFFFFAEIDFFVDCNSLNIIYTEQADLCWFAVIALLNLNLAWLSSVIQLLIVQCQNIYLAVIK